MINIEKMNIKYCNKDEKTITIFIPSLGGGGAENIVLRLMSGLIERNVKVTLILATPHGTLHSKIPQSVNIVHLNSARTIYSIIKLAKYLRNNKPMNLLSHQYRANRVALLAAYLGRTSTRVHIVEHSVMSIVKNNYKLVDKIFMLLTFRFLYKNAYNIIHVSKYAAKDLQELLPKDIKDIKTIYNPIVTKNFISESNITPPHTWLFPNQIPVILGAGIFRKEKDFLNLVEAFVIVKKHINSRLIILGRGDEEQNIRSRIKKHNIENSVLLPGYVLKPQRYMRYASVFVLSSRREALPTVLVEALASGCPVVSTNCPGGTAEILEGGKYGVLVPTNDPYALAEGIIETIINPPNKDLLKKKAMEFSVDISVDNYLNLLQL
jgi:glycosyltransferase involved in cell wall biosynthesis